MYFICSSQFLIFFLFLLVFCFFLDFFNKRYLTLYISFSLCKYRLLLGIKAEKRNRTFILPSWVVSFNLLNYFSILLILFYYLPAYPLYPLPLPPPPPYPQRFLSNIMKGRGGGLLRIGGMVTCLWLLAFGYIKRRLRVRKKYYYYEQ